MASSTYFALSNTLRTRIDNAYITICRSLPDFTEPQRKLNTPGPSAGGGGFIIEDAADDHDLDLSQLPNIPISHVPTGLQLLDLPPDDEQVLAVFRQAASGWDDENADTAAHESQVVSFDDWRAVCGILLEHHVEEYAESSDGGGHNSDRGEDGDEYEDEDNHPSDEDFKLVDESVPRQRRTRGKKVDSSDSDDSDSGAGPIRLTTRQKETCLETFALFFADATPEELPSKRIMISDVQRVAKLLKEKLKAEEIIEMLEIFSSSPDKFLNLTDFEQMMMVAKLA